MWLPTATTPPIGPYLALMEPFGLRSADQFRPGGPPGRTARCVLVPYLIVNVALPVV